MLCMSFLKCAVSIYFFSKKIFHHKSFPSEKNNIKCYISRFSFTITCVITIKEKQAAISGDNNKHYKSQQ